MVDEVFMNIGQHIGDDLHVFLLEKTHDIPLFRGLVGRTLIGAMGFNIALFSPAVYVLPSTPYLGMENVNLCSVHLLK